MSESTQRVSEPDTSPRGPKPPRLFRLRESVKLPLVHLMNVVGLDWHRRFVPSTKAGLVLSLKRMGWCPDTCVDVGAAWGTPEIQRGFPQSRHVLIEPNPLFTSHLSQLCSRNGWTLHQVAASDGPGRLRFFTGENHLGGRAVPDAQASSFTNGLIEVEATRLDDLDAQSSFGDNIFLKIDVEDHEAQVLAGADRVLSRSEVVVIETTPSGATTSSDIVLRMLEHDHLLAGFVTPWVESRNWPQLQMVDLVFVKKGSPLLGARPAGSRL